MPNVKVEKRTATISEILSAVDEKITELRSLPTGFSANKPPDY